MSWELINLMQSNFDGAYSFNLVRDAEMPGSSCILFIEGR